MDGGSSYVLLRLQSGLHGTLGAVLARLAEDMAFLDRLLHHAPSVPGKFPQRSV